MAPEAAKWGAGDYLLLTLGVGLLVSNYILSRIYFYEPVRAFACEAPVASGVLWLVNALAAIPILILGARLIQRKGQVWTICGIAIWFLGGLLFYPLASLHYEDTEAGRVASWCLSQHTT